MQGLAHGVSPYSSDRGRRPAMATRNPEDRAVQHETRLQSRCLPRAGRAGRLVALVLAAGTLAPAQGSDAAGAAPAAASSATRQLRHHAPPRALGDRVQLMAKELDLDPAQQAQLKTILQAQRAEVASVWSDASVPAAVRVGATRVIAERTADKIRAMLNDEQRRKYIKARPHDAPVGAPGGDVQKWMNSAQRPGLPATATAAAKGD
jgi:Spy/CpxP family protein refolding chaperone